MQQVGKWLQITLCASFVVLLVAAFALYFVSDYQIIVGQWGP